MSETASSASGHGLAPVSGNERIHALDIIRGFALIGIFLMNVEWFGRPIAFLGTGVDASLTGLDYAASWFVYTFVQGKFWTLFSLLFGMGFAVMLTRAEKVERAFVKPYVRRIVGLFLFGSAHFVMLWTGDILHNYAVTAIGLLLIVTKNWRAWLVIVASVVAVGFAIEPQSVQVMVAYAGLLAALAVLLERKTLDSVYVTAVASTIVASAFVAFDPISWKGMAIYAGVFAAVSALVFGIWRSKAVPYWTMLLAVATAFLAGKFETMQATPPFLALTALLMFYLNRGTLARNYKWAVVLFSLPFFLGLAFTGITAAVPALKPQMTEAQVQEQDKKDAERKVEREKEAVDEKRLYTQGTYSESVAERGKQYIEDLPGAAGLGFLALPMFLIGFWFIRSGVLAAWREHLPLFRRLASWTLPLGLAMTLASVALHASFFGLNGRTDPSVNVARGLFQWAMLPMSIGYFSLMICLIGTQLGEKILSPLRFAGQMALTNYIGATVISSFFFFGYGLGYYGQVGRAGQVLYVLVVFSLQLVFSYLWLSNFRYGPLEWLWRAITYWQLPAMRRTAAD